MSLTLRAVCAALAAAGLVFLLVLLTQELETRAAPGGDLPEVVYTCQSVLGVGDGSVETRDRFTADGVDEDELNASPATACAGRRTTVLGFGLLLSLPVVLLTAVALLGRPRRAV